MNKDIFKKRINVKPYEYPELIKFVDAINHSYWLHTEWNFTSDIHDFKQLKQIDREIIKRTMLAIAQIEVNVKTFWGNLYQQMPKPEINSVGVTFAESEVRHERAYSHLLELLGLNNEFEKVEEIPAIKDRIDYLTKYLEGSRSQDKQKYALSLILFSIFIENVSLFTQFLIMMSFNKYKNILKDLSAVVEATSKEEQLHSNLGIHLIEIFKQEHPEWFDNDFRDVVRKACLKAYKAERKILDWIFEEGELSFMSKDVIDVYMMNRFNISMNNLGLENIFTIDEEKLQETEWFDDEIYVTAHKDFFYKRPNTYSKKKKAITEDDLF